MNRAGGRLRKADGTPIWGLSGASESPTINTVAVQRLPSLRWALQRRRTKEEWLRVVKRMAGTRRSETDAPGTRAVGKKVHGAAGDRAPAKMVKVQIY